MVTNWEAEYLDQVHYKLFVDYLIVWKRLEVVMIGREASDQDLQSVQKSQQGKQATKIFEKKCH